MHDVRLYYAKAQNDSLTLGYKLERCHKPIKAQEILEFLEEKHFTNNSNFRNGNLHFLSRK
jgi:hypothetical protein